MRITVDRTCAEIGPSSDGRSEVGVSQPLSTFRSLPAYVLLGDPGAGKTTEFKRQCQELGDAAEYVRARDFIRLDLESHPEWRDTTLFIDGLDEMRAGAADSRIPLDEIRNRLERLDHPTFRISCREADWLGHNDRQSLEAVSPDGRIAVLRLDPLSEQAVNELLGSRSLGVGAEDFLHQARIRGVAGLLDNPLTLGLLADAVRYGGGWPASRLETFETACRQMATEQNDEHRAGAAPQSVATVLDCAGYLCALQLLSGIDGYLLSAAIEGSSFVSLETVAGALEHRSRSCLEATLASRLFTAPGERARSPVHRLVAEFLAGRYISALIREGLPARRALALMTSTGDGRVVTVLRGLSAWLAAHPGEARRHVIEADPVGAGIYGDIGGFTTDDKKRLLRSLAAFATEGPLSGHHWRDGRTGEAWYDSGWAFRSLASSDMASTIDELLRTAGAGSTGDRLIEFVLDLLSEADRTEIGSLAALRSTVRAILLEVTTPPGMRRRALDAYLRLSPGGGEKALTLARLLEAARVGELPDPDNELVGTLLDRLYPDLITPSQVWHFVAPKGRSDLVGRYWQFWTFTLEQRSSDEHVPVLLDALHEDASRVIPELDESQFEGLPVRLLERGLEACGDQLELPHLYNWLSTVGQLLVTSLPRDRARGVREWLEARPEIQKAVYLEWLRRRRRDDPLGYWHCGALHGSRLPADFGLWCLEQAIAIGDTEPSVSEELLSQAHGSLQDPLTGDGLTLDILRDRTRGRGTLTEHVDRLCRTRAGGESTDRDPHREEIEARRRQARDEQRQRREEWADAIRSRETELRENRFSPTGLDALAKAYFGLFVGIDHVDSPRSRIAEFMGGDRRLVDIVMAGLREAVTRDDVPAAERTISLHRESKHSWLAYPVLASLHLLDEEDPARLDGLDDALKRDALAVHYCVPLGLVSAPWHGRWFRDNPELVLDVLYRCAVTALRAGDKSPPGFNDLEAVTGHDDLVHDMRLRLLRAFPIRAPETQHRLLDRLLGYAFEYPDKSALCGLVQRKLSTTSMTVAQRVRWMATSALLRPGSGFAELAAWVGESERRVRHLAEFFRDVSDRRGLGGSILDSIRDPAALKVTIEMLGCKFRPFAESGLVPLEMDASDRISELIAQLGALAGDEAQRALRDLLDDPRLSAWQANLEWSLARQRVIHRDSSYCHPTIEQVQRTLADRAPSNVADLAVLLTERLRDISADIRGGGSNPWRHVWNEDRYGRPTDAKPETSGRDWLLESLDRRLPPAVDVASERPYASGKRADITATCGAFNVTIEIKRNSAVDLWSALRRQLIDQYTKESKTSGYGIFLVLWFGEGETTRRPDGSRPATTVELAQLLEQDLTPGEARKVSVIVMDVTKP